ncbi:MAG: 16S rRNA (cytidine(1402)-2'-O)-methyltransferase [Bifidobacteriaceae bacterium]|jgi:16S rRNA (cytidine1402-2'-O)-methyltransferase|nr:16S rRNA (cytidine(1402)-2'-O)-methyltransferase [Bifidobacteriaceae bacterium]
MSLIFAGLPIGNKDDVTNRIILAIKQARIIAAEDTRKFKIFLQKQKISLINTKIVSFYEHNEDKMQENLVNISLKENVLVVSDAGMPTISDPGWKLLKLAVEKNVELAILPGPSAFLLALIYSGFPIDKFTFLGFAPRKNQKIQTFYKEIARSSITTVFYESPHRIAKSLEIACKFLPGRKIALCRELTKIHEEIIRADIEEVLDIIVTRLNKGAKLGEITVVVSPN